MVWYPLTGNTSDSSQFFSVCPVPTSPMFLSLISHPRPLLLSSPRCDDEQRDAWRQRGLCHNWGILANLNDKGAWMGQLRQCAGEPLLLWRLRRDAALTILCLDLRCSGAIVWYLNLNVRNDIGGLRSCSSWRDREECHWNRVRSTPLAPPRQPVLKPLHQMVRLSSCWCGGNQTYQWMCDTQLATNVICWDVEITYRLNMCENVRYRRNNIKLACV